MLTRKPLTEHQHQQYRFQSYRIGLLGLAMLKVVLGTTKGKRKILFRFDNPDLLPFKRTLAAKEAFSFA